MKRTVIAALALLWAASASFAATYYVSPTGKDTNNGLTPQTAFASINAADSKGLLAPGDRVEVMSGTYNLKEANVVFKVSGTEEAPIVYSADEAVLTNGGYAFGGRADNLVIEGFAIKDSAIGVQIRGSNITVRNCVFENISDSCVYFMTGGGETVENCRFFDCTGTNCVQIEGPSSSEYGADNILRNNIFRGIDGVSVAVSSRSSNKIYNNTFLDTGKYILRIYTGNQPAKADIRNNIFEGADYDAVFCTDTASSITHSNNLYFNNRRDFTPGPAPAPGDLFGDPMLDPVTFAPLENSAAINTGIDVGLPYNGDAPDIGAVESDSQAKPGVVVARALRHGNNNPAAGVTIHAGNYYAVTGDDGTCRIPVPAGEWEVYADGDNLSRFKPVGDSQTVTVESEGTVSVDVYGEYQNNTYYVHAVNGSNENSGSEAYPFKSPCFADNNRLLEPGDTVVILHGGFDRYSESSLKYCSGTPDSPITYKGSSGFRDLVIENVSNLVFDGVGFSTYYSQGTALTINGDNIVIKNSRFSGASVGVDVKSGTGLVIDNCRFEFTVKEGGIRKETAVPATFTRNTFYSTGDYGMLLSGENTVYNNTFRHIPVGIEVLSGNTDVANTIMSGCEKGFVCGDGAVLTNSHTMFYNCETPATGCVLGENTLYDNPKLVDFVPVPGSPAVDAGKNVGLPYNGAAPDLGAIESEQSEYVRVTDDVSNIEDGTLVTVGEDYVVTHTAPLILTREDRLFGVLCDAHNDCFGHDLGSNLALGDRIVLNGVVKENRILYFDITSIQSGEKLRPLATYTLLRPYTLQRVFGKIKGLADMGYSVDTGKERVVVSNVGRGFCLGDMVCVTGVLYLGRVYARTANDVSVTRMSVLQASLSGAAAASGESSVDCEFNGIVPADNVPDTWGKAWLVNFKGDGSSSVNFVFKNYKMQQLTMRVKLNGKYSDWNIALTTGSSCNGPYVNRYEDGVYEFRWEFPLKTLGAKIEFKPKTGADPDTDYSAVITDVYIN